MCDGALIVAECKDNFADSEEKVEEICTQIEDEISIAKDIQAQVYLWATLKEMIPKRISDLLEEKARNEKNLTVRLVSREELFKGKLYVGKSTEFSDERQHVGMLIKPLPHYQGDCFERDNSAQTRRFWL